jgi:adenine-specific DNA-methyltransferase
MQLNAEDGGTRQCILVTNNENNIAEEVCYERNKRVIQGYTNSKDNWVNGLTNNNLRYYKCDFVESAKTQQNRRKLTRLSTNLLQIKEDCYTDITATNGFDPEICHISTNGQGKYMIVVYHSRQWDETVAALRQWIKTLPLTDVPIALYAFADEQEVVLDDFYDVAHRIKAAPLPDAIYNAYRSTFRSLKLEKKQPAAVVTEETAEEEETTE